MTADKRETILETALELFANQGFAGTSVRELAAKAGVNLAMINYYFGSKEKLFEVLVEQRASFIGNTLEVLQADTSLTAIQKVDKAIEAYVTRIFSNTAFHKLLQQELSYNNDELNETLKGILAKNFSRFKSIIQEGIQNGSFKNNIDIELSISSIIGTVSYLVVSKAITLKLLGKGKKECGCIYADKAFRKRLITHLQLMMHAYLLKDTKNSI